MNDKKTVRFETRMSNTLKEQLERKCTKQNIDKSAFVRDAIIEKLNSNSFEQETAKYCFLNSIYNITMAFPNLDKNYVNLLREELKKYECK